ncbi:MAG: PepSY domain-containing protein [Gammaproteobacteria bacterium]|nr:PepSY domain-containing protein [Gammaproteobacteria bacterium]MCI0590740.1 PepSY domain-containing protein [Gammaproteobacteria bacterium]
MRKRNHVRNMITIAALTGLATPALAGPGHHGLEACIKAALAIKSGDIVKVEQLIMVQGGEPTFEIEVRDDQNVEWELMCEADDGRIYEIEREADGPDDAAFKGKLKVSRQDAAATATAIFPGTIEETEYEIESNGDPTYEFDIVDASGTEFKVEVDAVSGKIIEVHVEGWEIGEEPEERSK